MTPSNAPEVPPAAAPVIELCAGPLRLALRPDLGGCIAGLWRGDVPVLLSSDAALLTSPRPSGGFVLAPYSNRLGHRRFRWQGHDHHTAANSNGSPHSMHGVAWARAWQVLSVSATEAELQLEHAGDADWPFAFTLRQRLVLTPESLALHLAFTNTDARAQPVGLGWHPYFAKRSRSRLHIELTDRWESDAATGLPTRKVAQAGIDADVAHLSFDHCFEGWRGAARIRDEKLSLKLSASLPYLVVYTPQDEPYFCVEPVSHVSNAIHMAEPLANGLRSAAPGETLDASFLLDVAAV